MQSKHTALKDFRRFLFELLQLCEIIPCLHHVVDVRVFSQRFDRRLILLVVDSDGVESL